MSVLPLNIKNYLLRVDGCKTDKGAALVLASPGQTQSKIGVKSGGSAANIITKELETAKVDTKENIKKEKYRIYPLRASGKYIRALRGARDFRVLKDYYQTNTSDYTQDKVVTKTDAYLYVTDAIKTTEYKVINRGDYSNPKVEKVQFKDTDTQVIRKYIPCYEEDGKLEIIYSNVKLTKEQQSKFTPVSVTLTDKKNLHCINHKDYSKSIKHTNKEMKDILISNKEAKKLNKSHLNIVVEIDDPIGEIEDLYEELECSFHTAYAHNKPLIDRIKERNAYAYSVANFMDELEVNSKEKQERKNTKKKLKDAYYTLVEGMKEDFIPYIIDVCKDRGFSWSIKDSNASFIRLNIFVEHDVAMSYLNEVKLNASFLLNTQHKNVRRGTINSQYYNVFDGRKIEHLNEKCIIESKSHDYLCLGVRAHIDGSKTSHKYATSTRESYTEITALTLFSLYFSGKHNDVIGTKYKDAIEDFHYNLKKLSAHPEFEEDIQEEINDKLKDSPYTKLFKDKNGDRTDNFIDDYENLETIAKDCAFEWEGNDKTQLLKFATLIPKKETFEFFYEIPKHRESPQKISETLSKELKSSQLKELLEKYSSLKDTSLERIGLLLNIAYSLTASRTMFDEEVNQTSPFNTDSAVMDFLISISKKLQVLKADEHEKLYKEDIFQLYHKSLHSLILHSLVKGSYNEKEFSSRQDNVTKKFLDVIAPETAKEYQLDLTKLDDGSIDKNLQVKKTHEKLFAQLKALDGITSQIHAAEDKQREGEKASKSNKANDGLTIETEKKFPTLRNSKPYKITIPALKGLSFFVALYQTGKILKDYQKMTLSSLLELSVSINVLSKITGEAAQATKLLSSKAIAYNMFKAMKEEKLVFQKVLTKLAIPIVIFGAYHEIASLNDKDYDAVVALSVKTGLTIALMLFATGIGEILIIGIAIELIWMSISSYIIDTNVEVMIEKSLFYQNGRKPYILESLSSDTKEYLYKDNFKSIKEIPFMQKPKDMRDFIYANYSSHKKEFNAAFSYELSSFYATLKGVNIEKSGRSKQDKSSKATYAVCSYVSISKDFYKDIKRIVLLEDDKEIEIDISQHELKNGKEYIDLLSHLDISDSSVIQEYSKKDTKLLLHSDAISLKYDVIYYYDDASKYLKRLTGGALKIIDIKSLPLTKDDCKILNIQMS
ncbi:hypothetical protein [Sulfurimonas sp.]|uniref:hypothetical protein n=1 Tax=Sulfurimonas sp. TaxID=2022749 RepID=UPI002B45A5F3|nr:hypothetical protein [Sulfurimonas sp.]